MNAVFVRVILCLLVQLALAGRNVAVAGEMECRREAKPAFEVDTTYLEAGNVQYFLGVLRPDGSGMKDGAASAVNIERAFEGLRLIDRNPPDCRALKLHILVSRVVYIAKQPITFFSESRVRDARYMHSIAPQFEIEAEPDGTYRSQGSVLKGLPSVRFGIGYKSGTNLQLPTPLLEWDRSQRPKVLVEQRNYDFGKVLGFRTSEGSVSTTAHYEFGRDETLIVNCSISYLHTVPPVRTAATIHGHALEQTRAVIGNLREYVPQEGKD